MSVEDLEGNLVMRIVQKFFDELLKDQPQRAQKQEKSDSPKDRHEDALEKADAIIKEASNAVARGLRDRVA